MARSGRLRRSDPLGEGYHRVRNGRGFSYRSADGAAVRDAALRARFEALAIPPAWTDVWIAPYENGHIQAVGVDGAGRKQYRYHPDWRARHDRTKFARMLELAEALPRARRRVKRHLADTGFTRRRVLAAAFLMLDAGGLRIGSSRYEEQNGSFGLTTLHREHAVVRGDRVRLRFPAKSGKQWDSTITDRRLAALVRSLQRRDDGGARLLAWRDEAGWHDLSPAEVNAYVRRRTGDRFTAKDFRTLRGTTTAAWSLAVHGVEPAGSARKRAIADAIRDAAAALSNTPAVAKASYVDPRIVDRYRAGETIDPTRPKRAELEVHAMLFEPSSVQVASPRT